MFDIESDNTIHLTRGDILYFGVSAQDSESKEKNTFQSGDIVRMSVYGKKDCTNVVMQKDFVVTTPVDEVEIFLEGKDTKIGEAINKPKDYWYEIVLNPDTRPQTIIGYSGDGATVLRLYPEGEKIPSEDEEITDEKLSLIDDKLDATSERAIMNKAVASAILALMNEIETLKSEIILLKTSADYAEEGETI